MKYILIVGAAALLVSCANLLEKAGPELVAHEGGPAKAVFEHLGGPDFRHADADGEYLVYRAINNNRGAAYCHAIYTLHGDEVATVDLVGNRCEGAKTWTRVTVLSEDLAGKPLVEALKAFGAPNFSDIKAGTGRLVYRLAKSEPVTSGTIGGGSVTGSIGLVMGCTVNVRVADGIIESAEAGGGLCWATPIPRVPN